MNSKSENASSNLEKKSSLIFLKMFTIIVKELKQTNREKQNIKMCGK